MPFEYTNEVKEEQQLNPVDENRIVRHPRVIGQSARESFTDYGNPRENVIRVVEGDDIQEALNKLETIGGGILHFKTGIHRLQKGFIIPAFITVEGEGQDNTRLDFEDRNLQITVLGTSSSLVKNVRLRDLTIERSGHATAAVQFAFASHFIIDNIRFSDNAANGLRLVACTQYAVRDSLSDNNGDDGYDLDGSGTSVIHSAFHFSGCIATNNTGNGFAIFGDINNLTKLGSFHGCVSSNNTTDGYDINTGIEVAITMHGCYAGNNGGIGIDINSNDVKVMGCIVEDNTGDGIEISKTGCSVIGTLTEGNGTDTDYQVVVDTGGGGGISTTTAKAKAYRATSVQSIPTGGSTTKIQLNAESYDPGNNFDSTTDYDFTVPTTGYYLITAAVKFNTSPADQDNFRMVVRAGATDLLEVHNNVSGASDKPSVSGSVIASLTANDLITLNFSHSNGGSLNIELGDDVTFMAIHLLSTD